MSGKLFSQARENVMHWIYAHLIGDYLLQTDWMATRKKTSHKACVAHVAAYMLPFLLTPFTWWQLLLVAGQHYAQDKTNFVVWFMKIKHSEGFTKEPFFPWSIILTDNIIHVLWMALVAAIPGWIT